MFSLFLENDATAHSAADATASTATVNAVNGELEFHNIL